MPELVMSMCVYPATIARCHGTAISTPGEDALIRFILSPQPCAGRLSLFRFSTTWPGASFNSLFVLLSVKHRSPFPSVLGLLLFALSPLVLCLHDLNISVILSRGAAPRLIPV